MLIRLTVRVVIALACAAAVVVSLIARDSRLAAERALIYYVNTQDVRGTLERFDDARPLNPTFELDITESRLRPDQGQAILKRAIEKEPENAELWLRLAQRQVIDGDREAAQRSYARARRLAPSFLAPDGPPPGF